MVARAWGLARIAVALAIVGACGGDSEPADPVGGGGADGCVPGETTLSDGRCQPAGIPPEACAEGFVPNNGGCDPTLPSAPCADGLLALPGEARCRQVATCSGSRWGAAPIGAGTVFVDAGYTAGDSDGSEARPFATIAEATAMAPAGGLVAIAAGEYPEWVGLTKPLVLWGSCTHEVTILGTGNEAVLLGGAGGELHDLAITGSGAGVVALGGGTVRLEQLWIHHTTSIGVVVEEQPTVLEISLTLIEQAYDLGILAFGADVTVHRSVVREIQPRPSDMLFGGAIEIHDLPPSEGRLGLMSSLLEGNHDFAVFFIGADGTIDSSVIRDTHPASDGQFGRALDIEDALAPHRHARVNVRASVFERNHDLSVFVAGSELLFEYSVIRDTLARASDQHFGRAIHIQDRPEVEQRGMGTIVSSLIERSHDVGVMVANADATLSSTWIREVAPRALDGLYGDGVVVSRTQVDQQFTGRPFASALVSGSRIEGVPRAALANFGAEVTLEWSALGCSTFYLDGEDDIGFEPVFESRGENRCACGDDVAECKISSSTLAPPEPVQ